MWVGQVFSGRVFQRLWNQSHWSEAGADLGLDGRGGGGGEAADLVAHRLTGVGVEGGGEADAEGAVRLADGEDGEQRRLRAEGEDGGAGGGRGGDAEEVDPDGAVGHVLVQQHQEDLPDGAGTPSRGAPPASGPPPPGRGRVGSRR